MPDHGLIKRLQVRLRDEFARDLLQGALDALTQKNVNTRVHHFSVSFRELSSYMLKQMAPDDDAIKRCTWYKQNPETDGPTRRQRALYASRGGLSDSFVKNGLKLDPKEFHRKIGPAFEELNKRTHLRPDTVITDPTEIEAFANEAISALLEIFEVTDDVQAEIIRHIESHLHDEAIDTFINETIDSLDLIAGHYETGIVWADEMRVLSIDADSIRYEVTGEVDVTLHYGSGSDETSIDESFPFTCNTAASIDKPLQLRKDTTEANVDTSGWYGQEPEE